jgi:hypothetical protein
LNRNYDPDARGSLAQQALKKMPSIGKKDIEKWLRTRTDRIDFVLSPKFGLGGLAMLQSFLWIRFSRMFDN